MHRYTTPCGEILLSEKQQQPETCTAMNDISQGSVATWFRWGGIFYTYFVTNWLL